MQHFKGILASSSGFRDPCNRVRAGVLQEVCVAVARFDLLKALRGSPCLSLILLAQFSKLRTQRARKVGVRVQGHGIIEALQRGLQAAGTYIMLIGRWSTLAQLRR